MTAFSELILCHLNLFHHFFSLPFYCCNLYRFEAWVVQSSCKLSNVNTLNVNRFDYNCKGKMSGEITYYEAPTHLCRRNLSLLMMKLETIIFLSAAASFGRSMFSMCSFKLCHIFHN